MRVLIISIFISAALIFYVSCNSEESKKSISRVLIIDESIENESLNKRVLLELNQNDNELCNDGFMQGLLHIEELNSSMVLHPAFSEIYGCQRSFALSQVRPVNLSFTETGKTYMEIKFTGIQIYHDLNMIRILHEPFFVSDFSITVFQNDRLRSYKKSNDFRVDSYYLDSLVINQYPY